jgi:hypothetical protein
VQWLLIIKGTEMRKIVLAMAVLAGFAAPTVANAGGVNWCRYIVANQCIR